MIRTLFILFLSFSLFITPIVGFSGGVGSVGDPYLVSSCDELQNISEVVNLDKHYLQSGDIDCGISPYNVSPGFSPIGNCTGSCSYSDSNDFVFNGSYDGNNTKNEEWDENKFEENFNTREIRIIYDKKSKLKIGFFQIKYKKDLTYIKEIQIQKEYQNKGYGTEILNIIKKEAKEKNLPKLQLKVFQDNQAIQLYEKFGFRITEKIDTSYIMEL